nr:hypothetical protein [Candidatus Krumholzibacteria bacterium]
MPSRRRLLTLSGLFLLVTTLAFSLPTSVLAECSEADHVAVFLIRGIDAGSSQALERVSVAPVGDVTYPSDADIYTAIMSIFQEAVNPAISAGPVLGNLCLWQGVSGSDHQTIVDLRDGQVLFAGTVIWMGSGAVFRPEDSSHSWSMAGGEAAPGPAQTGLFANGYWDGMTPTAAEVFAQGLELIRGTDVMHSFGGCGEYTATGVIYTPTVGALDPGAAQLVIVVEGQVGAPWNDQSLAVESFSWGGLKAVFR